MRNAAPRMRHLCPRFRISDRSGHGLRHNIENSRYQRVVETTEGKPVPEKRWRPALVGTPWISVALLLFAWTDYPQLTPYASTAAVILFGFGMVIVYVSITNYIVSNYTISSTSTLAANTVPRSLFPFAFPLLTTPMSHNLEMHCASWIPVFLALV